MNLIFLLDTLTLPFSYHPSLAPRPKSPSSISSSYFSASLCNLSASSNLFPNSLTLLGLTLPSPPSRASSVCLIACEILGPLSDLNFPVLVPDNAAPPRGSDPDEEISSSCVCKDVVANRESDVVFPPFPCNREDSGEAEMMESGSGGNWLVRTCCRRSRTCWGLFVRK